MSQHRAWSENRGRMQGEGVKDEKREITDNEEEHY